MKLKLRLDYQLKMEDYRVYKFIKYAALEISGKVSFSKEGNQDLYNKNISVNIMSDVMPFNKDSLITDLDGFKEYLKSVPSLLKKTNGGLGVPLEYNLFPLALLFDKNKDIAMRTIREINEESLNKSIKTMDLINSVKK